MQVLPSVRRILRWEPCSVQQSMNDMLIKHPMDGVRFSKPVRAVDDIKFLTVEEQAAFLETAKRSHNYRQYVLLLETGLRTSE